MDDITELEIEIAALRKRLKKFEDENYKLRRILQENEIEEAEGLVISDEEFICINEIRKLKELSQVGSFGREEAQVLDILYKNLRQIRNLSDDKLSKSKKKPNVAELFKIVDGLTDGKDGK